MTMKKTVLLAIVFFLYIQSAVSQELPTIIPPSPTPFQMTRYGDVPINESTGKISPSIPLYTYQAGRLQLPISLSYQGNGVKVDQAASWTGINWNLNAGGVITRTVRGEDDLYFNGVRSSYSYDDLYYLDQSNLEDVKALNAFITSSAYSAYDTEADIFNFSFMGYSGGFYLDKNLQPQLTKYENELKIELDETPPLENEIIQHFKRKITITTPDGVIYSFGGLNASESSYVHRQSAGSSVLQDEEAQTSFFLYEIEHPMGDKIFFKYNSYSYNINIAKSKSYTKVVSVDISCSEAPNPELEKIRYESLNLKSANAKVLNEIWSNRTDYKINLNSSNASSSVSQHYSNVLNTIEVGKLDASSSFEVFKVFSFSYEFPFNGNSNDKANAERFFLKEVKFLNSGYTKDYSYEMEYNDPENLPNRFSYSQDHLGFYNGKNDNQDMLPQTIHPAFLTNYNSFADKSSNFNFGSKGALTHIYYPTGGHTKFIYEPIFDKNKSATNTKHKTGVLYMNYNNQPPGGIPNRNPYSVSIGLPSLIGLEQDGVSVATTTNENIIKQNLNIEISNIISSGLLDRHTKFCLKIYDRTDNVFLDTQTCKNIAFNQNPSTSQHPYLGLVYHYPDMVIKSKQQLIEGHSYNIEITIVPHGISSNLTIYSKVDFDYKVSTDEKPQTGEIRLRSTIDNPNNRVQSESNLGIIKNYSYSDEYILSPRYLKGSTVVIWVLCSSLSTFKTPNRYGLVTLSSSTFNTIYINSSQQQTYKNVNISFGDSKFVKGYIKRKFIKEIDPSPQVIIFNPENSGFVSSSVRENKSSLNGKLLEETIFANHGGDLVLSKQTINKYSIDRNTYYDNNISHILYEEINNSDTTLSNLAIEYYRTYSNKIQLDSTTTKTFDYSKIEDLSMLDTDGDGLIDSEDPDDDDDGQLDFLDPDANGNGVADVDEPEPQPEVIETTTSYEYTQHVGLPTKITISTSKSDELLETTYQYPLTNTTKSSYISDPTFIKTYKTTGDQSKLTSSLSKVYQYQPSFDTYSGAHQMLSKIITTKGPEFDGTDFTFEDRVFYHDYDAYGNPLEVSKADGTHIVYIWGYNQTQPIAKIENATYADVQIQVANLQALSNADNDRTIDTINQDGTITKVGKEGNLREALRNLRTSLKNVLVTTYTYDPLIGVTSVTDPRGNTVYYEYDPFNRLKHVKDQDGNILSQNEYNYKN